MSDVAERVLIGAATRITGLPVRTIQDLAAGGPICVGSLRGKKAAGHLLDGREHREVPNV